MGPDRPETCAQGRELLETGVNELGHGVHGPAQDVPCGFWSAPVRPALARAEEGPCSLFSSLALAEERCAPNCV